MLTKNILEKKYDFEGDNYTTEISYDSYFGLKETISHSDIGSINLTYKENGLLETQSFLDKKNTLNRTELYDYDINGRIKVKKIIEALSGKSEKIIFDYIGTKVASIGNSQYVKDFDYLNDGRIKEQKLSIKNIGSLYMKNTYFSHKELKERLYISKMNEKSTVSKISYKLNSIGQINEIHLNESKILNLTYDSINRLKEVISSNLTQTMVYDEHSQKLIGRTFKNTNLITKYTWLYNNFGLIESESYVFNNNSLSKKYIYNENHWLTSMTKINNETSENSTYEYNEEGMLDIFNKTNLKITNKKWFYGENTYTLDSMGRVISKNKHTFKYGTQGRITKASNGTKVVNFVYDETGLLINKFSKHSKSIYSDDILVKNGVLFIPIKVNKQIVGYVKGNQYFPLMTTSNGSLVKIKDGKLNTNTAYGKRSEIISDQDFLDYASKGFDKDLGAIRMGHRWYDPEIKRFLTPDPYFFSNPQECIKSPVECNLYSYAKNDPVNFVDPSGYYSQGLQMIINQLYANNEPQKIKNSLKEVGTSIVKISAGGAALGLSGIAIPALVSAAAPQMAGLALSAVIKTNSLLIGTGMMIAKNPKAAQDTISSSLSIFNDIFFKGQGKPPSIKLNTYGKIKTSYKLGMKPVEEINSYITNTKGK